MSRRAPVGLGPAGRRLWSELNSANLGAARLALLREAARTADACEVLHVDVEDSEGAERRRVLAELRQQRLALARLVAAIRPEVDEKATEPTPGALRLAQLRATVGRPSA